ncbi:MAG: hypothetical protein AUH85_11800 [Chloroflexi bacterium 13_1_40CM_4_68_4]|nr:MAG: hypothetical protein AUH85_11800 [Chloroflexi bacterium 13_1_40CM_4_68_4]
MVLLALAPSPLRRVLVVGRGFFGGLVASRLRDLGLAPLVAARHGGDVRLDAEDDASLRNVLRHGDVIVDTAGPFAVRSTRLVRMSMEVGCDVIDLAESLAWSEAIVALDGHARDAGVRLYPACSAVAAVAGACLRASGIADPVEPPRRQVPRRSAGSRRRWACRSGRCATGSSSGSAASRRRGTSRTESAPAVSSRTRVLSC